MFSSFLLVLLSAAPAHSELLDGAWAGRMNYQYQSSTRVLADCNFRRDVTMRFDHGFLMIGEEAQTMGRLPGGEWTLELDQPRRRENANARWLASYVMARTGDVLIVSVFYHFYSVLPGGEERIEGICSFVGGLTPVAGN